MAKNRLVCHIMENEHKEVGTAKSRTINQEFTWKKRVFPINRDAIYTDKKGTSHLFVQVNESDGTYRFMFNVKENIIDDKCVACGGKISIDAKNVRDMIKRKTITAIWGVDQSYILMILIMGIAMVIMAGAVFYLLGDNTATHQALEKYLPKPETTVTAH